MTQHRRTFLRQLSALGLMGAVPGRILAGPENGLRAGLPQGDVRQATFGGRSGPNDDKKIWACLLHLSFNFAAGIKKYGGLRTEFEPSEALWNDAVAKMANSGMNMVLINLDDSVRWDSHPEIALRNAWTPTRLQQELDKIRRLGMEPIPMFNFSTTHDAWLGKYSRMVSTPTYYNVCRDLIAEAIALFGQPRFFHLGMDEETAAHQRQFDYVVVRQNDLWWGDFYYLIGEVEKGNARPWVWSDYYWHNPDTFLKKMPRSVLQSNWYYGENFTMDQGAKNQGGNFTRTPVEAYLDLEANGYDQVPTASNDQNNPKSIGNTVRFCEQHIQDARLLGFLQTFWKPTIEEYRKLILEGIELTGEAEKWYNGHHGKS